MATRLLSRLMLLAVLVLAPATSAPAQTSGPELRILSLGGDVTEILYALGMGEKIVAVDSTSQFPPEALKDKKNVGYVRALSTEGVLSVNANLVVATDRAGPADIVKALKAAVRYVEVGDSATAEQVPEKIVTIARAVGREDAGKTLADKVRGELAGLEKDKARINGRVRALFILNLQAGRAVVGGAGTSADLMLKLAGLDNAATGISGFKPVGDEALLGLNPGVVVTINIPGGHDSGGALKLPGLARSDAAAHNALITMEPNYLLGLGPRIASAARELMQQAYPTLRDAKP